MYIIDNNGSEYRVRVTREDSSPPVVWLDAGGMDWGAPLLPEHGALDIDGADRNLVKELADAGWRIAGKAGTDASDARVSISELEALRVKMTPGEYRSTDYDHSDGIAMYIDSDNGEIADTRSSDRPGDDAAGLVAEHNAMPALLALAKAALDLEKAKKAAGSARYAWGRAIDSNAPDESARLEQVDRNDQHLDRCLAAYAAALQAVRP